MADTNARPRRGGGKGARVIGKLKGAAPARLKPQLNASGEPARTFYSDGGNLYLVVEKTGSRHWAFVYRERISGKSARQEIGLGSFLNVTLDDARQKAAELRRLIGQGTDPKSAVIAARAQSRTFGDVVEEYLEARFAVGGQNAKHVRQWRTTLTDYCAPISGKPISKLAADDVLAILTQTTIADRDLGGPFWATRHETASRLRGRIEAVLDYAMTKGMLSGANPAKWQGALKGALRGLTPSQPEAHHAAMPYADVPAFMLSLRARPATAARALEFAILTAARTGEVIGARWEEIDFMAALWRIPASRMKANAEHQVPLSARAIEILNEMKGGRDAPEGFVFTGEERRPRGRQPIETNSASEGSEAPPLSNMAMLQLLKRMDVPATVHGFRSSFRDFAGDRTAFPRDVAEAALAHKLRDKVEAAYRRSSALEKRRELMEAWSTFCGTEPDAKVIPLARGA